jgi:hypothetical protein
MVSLEHIPVGDKFLTTDVVYTYNYDGRPEYFRINNMTGGQEAYRYGKHEMRYNARITLINPETGGKKKTMDVYIFVIIDDGKANIGTNMDDQFVRLAIKFPVKKEAPPCEKPGGCVVQGGFRSRARATARRQRKQKVTRRAANR